MTPPRLTTATPVTRQVPRSLRAAYLRHYARCKKDHPDDPAGVERAAMEGLEREVGGEKKQTCQSLFEQ